MNTPRFSRSFCWPMNSVSANGRSESSGASSGFCSVVIMRPSLTAAVLECRSLRQLPEAVHDQIVQFGPRFFGGKRLGDRAIGFGTAVTEVDQGRDGIVDDIAALAGLPRRNRDDVGGAEFEPRGLVLQFGDDALRELRADAIGARDRSLVLGCNGMDEIVGAQRREDGQRHLA